MMELDIQIKSLIFSFIYGIFFSFVLNLNYKYVYKSKGIYKIVINALFIIDNVLLYFLILKKINSGIIHFYFILMIILGFILFHTKFKKLYSKIKFKH
jgi:hypothetical protein